MEESSHPNKPRWYRISKQVMTVVLTVVILAMLITFTGIGAAAGFVASLVKDQPIPSKKELSKAIHEFSQTSYIYDRNKKLIGTGELRTGDDRDLVTLKDVSPYIIDAFISTEDKQFYDHIGIVPRSLLRATYQDLSGSPTTTGGSTITQQLVKLSVLKNPEQTYSRKAKEIFLALRLDRLFEKEEILTSYLNRIYFGKGASGEHLYGIEAAAKGIFDVQAKDVNLAQAAYLAGIPQRPNAYSPFEKETLQAGLKRQQTVLKRMLDNGKITKKQYEDARSFNIAQSLAKPRPYVYEQYPYLYEAIHKRTAEALMQADGIKIDKLKKDAYETMLAQYKQRAAEGGYRIYTTVDLKLYDALNKAVQEYSGYKPDVKVKVKGINETITAKEQVGATVLDVKTGAILAFVGGRDHENIKNRALDARKQPGSSAKPLLAYGPGMARGVLQPGTIVQDTPEAAQVTRGYRIKNYGGNFHGPVTVRKALQWSYNVPAMDAFKKVGVENGYQFIAQMNMPVPPEEHVYSGVLGSNVFTTEQMAGAYATFANSGAFNETFLIDRIETADGKTVFKQKVKPKQVMSPQSAYLLTDVLRDVVRSGTGSWIGSRISGAYDIAGKTGTTQHSKDVWFVGYTPHIAMSVWVGYDYEQSTPVVRPNENLAKIMWARLFHTIQQTKPKLSPAGSRFPTPGGIVSASICEITGKRATKYCQAAGTAYTELFQAGHVPGEACDLTSHGEDGEPDIDVEDGDENEKENDKEKENENTNQDDKKDSHDKPKGGNDNNNQPKQPPTNGGDKNPPVKQPDPKPTDPSPTPEPEPGDPAQPEKPNESGNPSPGDRDRGNGPPPKTQQNEQSLWHFLIYLFFRTPLPFL